MVDLDFNEKSETKRIGGMQAILGDDNDNND
jgi:hypothetical protein